MKLIMEGWRKFLKEAVEGLECPAAAGDVELNTKIEIALLKNLCMVH